VDRCGVDGNKLPGNSTWKTVRDLRSHAGHGGVLVIVVFIISGRLLLGNGPRVSFYLI
jgi:hypothetical protein